MRRVVSIEPVEIVTAGRYGKRCTCSGIESVLTRTTASRRVREILIVMRRCVEPSQGQLLFCAELPVYCKLLRRVRIPLVSGLGEHREPQIPQPLLDPIYIENVIVFVVCLHPLFGQLEIRIPLITQRPIPEENIRHGRIILRSHCKVYFPRTFLDSRNVFRQLIRQVQLCLLGTRQGGPES